jgi:hypothetical protein
MIKAKGEDEHGHPVLLFGLSGENLRRLRQGQPIKINLAEMGLAGYAVIFYGNTEAAMVAHLREAGMLSEDLISHPTTDVQA